jgi:hypothetical protein
VRDAADRRRSMHVLTPNVLRPQPSLSRSCRSASSSTTITRVYFHQRSRPHLNVLLDDTFNVMASLALRGLLHGGALAIMTWGYLQLGNTVQNTWIETQVVRPFFIVT